MVNQADFEKWMKIDRPEIVVTPPGPKAKALIDREEAVTNPVHGRGTSLCVEKAYGVWVEDPDGNRYLDCTSGIGVTNVGHCHPEIVSELQKQSEKFFHYCGADFYYEQQTVLTEKLMEVVPVKDPVVFFTNSGAESTEAAMKLTRYNSGRPRYMALRGSFHGRTNGAMAMTSSKAVQRGGFAPLISEVTHVPNPYCYRCPYGKEYPSCKMQCVDAIEEYFETIAPPYEIAAFFAEPLQGEGGYIVPPQEYFPRLQELLRKHDILLVMDEVQAGNGRTGKMYASEYYDFEPDILYTAKGLGSGFPIGAMISRKDITTWPPGAHSNTYGGNPMGCMVGAKGLELIQGMLPNVIARGKQLIDGLKELQKKHDFIGDVRGRGLMVAMEMVKDPDTKEYAPDIQGKVISETLKKGVICYGCGKSCVRFIPPLCITENQINSLLEVLAEVLPTI